MLLIRRSILTGHFHSKELDITQEQLDAVDSGALIQEVFPHLCAEDREFIKSGITYEEWDRAFPEEYEQD